MTTRRNQNPNIEARLAELGMDKKMLAKRTGISVFKLSRILNGRQELKQSDMERIALGLKCFPVNLWPELAGVSNGVANISDSPAQHASAVAPATNGGSDES